MHRRRAGQNRRALPRSKAAVLRARSKEEAAQPVTKPKRHEPAVVRRPLE